MSIRLNVLPRLAASVGAAALLFAFGCATGPQEGDGEYGAASVDCPKTVADWAPGTKYAVGDLVTFAGGVFQCRQAHTPAPDWFPNIVPALWTPVACNGVQPPAQPPAQQPPVQQPPAQQPPAQQPPVNNGPFTVLADVDQRAFTFGIKADLVAANAGVPGIVNLLQANNVTAAAFFELGPVAKNAVVKVNGSVREVDLTVGGVKRLHSTYDTKTGAFQGILVGNGSDQGAPFCVIITPNVRGFLYQMVADVGNNLKNDFQGIAQLDSNLNTVQVQKFIPGNGGLGPQGPGANTACPTLARQFGFSLKGF
jgi:hypothetical protein